MTPPALGGMVLCVIVDDGIVPSRNPAFRPRPVAQSNNSLSQDSRPFAGRLWYQHARRRPRWEGLLKHAPRTRSAVWTGACRELDGEWNALSARNARDRCRLS